MSALAEIHPNTLEALEWRRLCIRHAARTLHRDQRLIDPKGHLAVIDWLRRLHYVYDEHGQPDDRLFRAWLRHARVDPLTPVRDLRPDQRDRLICQMLDFAKGHAR